MAFVIKCSHTCGEIHVDMLVSVVALNVWEWTMLDGTITPNVATLEEYYHLHSISFL